MVTWFGAQNAIRKQGHNTHIWVKKDGPPFIAHQVQNPQTFVPVEKKIFHRTDRESLLLEGRRPHTLSFRHKPGRADQAAIRRRNSHPGAELGPEKANHYPRRSITRDWNRPTAARQKRNPSRPRTSSAHLCVQRQPRLRRGPKKVQVTRMKPTLRTTQRGTTRSEKRVPKQKKTYMKTHCTRTMCFDQQLSRLSLKGAQRPHSHSQTTKTDGHTATSPKVKFPSSCSRFKLHHALSNQSTMKRQVRPESSRSVSDAISQSWNIPALIGLQTNVHQSTSCI